MPDWRLLNIRLTAFVTPDASVPASLWKDMTGEEPEESTVQRISATKAYVGPYQDGTLALQVQPMRIDWIYGAQGIVADTGQPQFLGISPQAAEPMRYLSKKWIESDSFPAVQRIALGMMLMIPTESRELGYQKLGEFIECVPNPDEASDFLYQINRPRDARVGIPGLRVNRLSKWSVAQVQLVTVGAAPPRQTDYHQCQVRLELDISTNAEFDIPLPRAKIASVVDDLFEAAGEVISRQEQA